MKFKIDKGIECSSKRFGCNKFDETINEMNIGDSVLFTPETIAQFSYEAQRFSNRIKVLGFQSSCKKVDDKNYRVWKLNKKTL